MSQAATNQTATSDEREWVLARDLFGNPGSFRRSMCYLLAISLAVRVLWVVVAAREPTFLADPFIYRNTGQAIADGKGYVNLFSGESTAYFPPGYPFLVGFLVKLSELLGFIDPPLLIGLIQAAMSAATVALVGQSARRCFGDRAGLVAAGMMALAPNLIMHTGVILSETFYLLLLAMAVYAAILLVDTTERAPRLAAASGVALGASALVRPQGLLIALALAWWWWRCDPPLERIAARRERVVRIGVAALCCVAVMAPWTLRNLVVMDAAILVSTNVGDNLCIGHGPEAYGGFRLAPDCVVEHQTQGGSEDEVLHNDEVTDIALESIKDDPLRTIGLTWTRVFDTVRNDHDGLTTAEEFGREEWLSAPVRESLRWSANLWWYGLVAACVVAVIRFRAWRSTIGQFMMLGALLALTAPATTFAHPRFKIPMLIFMVILASGLWTDRTWHRPTIRRGRRIVVEAPSDPDMHRPVDLKL